METLNASLTEKNTISVDDVCNFRVDYLYGVHFTHNDGDGIGCAIVTDMMCMEPKMIMKSCLPVFCSTNANKEIRKFLINTIVALHYQHLWDQLLDEMIESLNLDQVPTIPELKEYFGKECQTSFQDRPLYSSYEITKMGDYAKTQYKRVVDYVYMSKFENDSIAFQVNKSSKFFEQTSIPGYIFISDVMLNEENAALLDILKKNYGLFVTYVDHHYSNRFPVDKYNWASVLEIDKFSGKKEAACYQLLQHLCYIHNISVTNLYNPVLFTNTIRCASLYDTWEWRNRIKDDSRSPNGRHWSPDTKKLCEKAPILEAIITAYGIKMIQGDQEVRYRHLLEMYYDLRIDLFSAKPIIPNYYFMDNDDVVMEVFYVPCLNPRESDGPIYLDDIPKYKFILEEYYRKMEYAAEKSKLSAISCTGEDLVTIGLPGFSKDANCSVIILPDEFQNSAMEGVYRNSETPVDVVLGVRPTTNIISFRRGTKYIDLGVLARDYYNGGGHPDASGGKLNKAQMLKLMNFYLEKHFKE